MAIVLNTKNNFSSMNDYLNKHKNILLILIFLIHLILSIISINTINSSFKYQIIIILYGIVFILIITQIIIVWKNISKYYFSMMLIGIILHINYLIISIIIYIQYFNSSKSNDKRINLMVLFEGNPFFYLIISYINSNVITIFITNKLYIRYQISLFIINILYIFTIFVFKYLSIQSLFIKEEQQYNRILFINIVELILMIFISIISLYLLIIINKISIIIFNQIKESQDYLIKLYDSLGIGNICLKYNGNIIENYCHINFWIKLNFGNSLLETPDKFFKRLMIKKSSIKEVYENLDIFINNKEDRFLYLLKSHFSGYNDHNLNLYEILNFIQNNISLNFSKILFLGNYYLKDYDDLSIKVKNIYSIYFNIRHYFNIPYLEILFKKINDNDSVAQKNLIEESKINNQIISKISHEFTTPCIAIQNLSHSIKDYLKQIFNNLSNKKDLKKYNKNISAITRIKFLSEIILIIVSDLSEYVKAPDKFGGNILHYREKRKNFTLPLNLVSYKVKLQALRVYLYNISVNLLDIYSKKNFEINFEFDEDLKEKQILIDEKKLRQILYNLVSNAVKYTTRGGIEIIFYSTNEVKEETEESKSSLIYSSNNELNSSKDNLINETLTIIIKDTGDGMPDSLINLINSDTIINPNEIYSREIEGNEIYGMGLYICKKLSKQIGIKIEARKYILEDKSGSEIILQLNNILENIAKNETSSKYSLCSKQDEVDLKSNNIGNLILPNLKERQKSVSSSENLSNIKKNSEMSSSFNSSLKQSSIINLKKMDTSFKELVFDPINMNNSNMKSRKSLSNTIKIMKPKGSFTQSSFKRKSQCESLTKIKYNNFDDLSKKRHSFVIEKRNNFSPVYSSIRKNRSLKKKNYKNKLSPLHNKSKIKYNSFNEKINTSKDESVYNKENIKILLIDDNNEILSTHYNLFSNCLNSRNITNYNILKLNDGIEGLYEIYKDHIECNKSIKLIICDESMDFMKGTELFGILRSKFKDYCSKFIIVSAFLDNEFKILVNSLGIENYSKPIPKGIANLLCEKYISSIEN